MVLYYHDLTFNSSKSYPRNKTSYRRSVDAGGFSASDAAIEFRSKAKTFSNLPTLVDPPAQRTVSNVAPLLFLPTCDASAATVVAKKIDHNH